MEDCLQSSSGPLDVVSKYNVAMISAGITEPPGECGRGVHSEAANYPPSRCLLSLSFYRLQQCSIIEVTRKLTMWPRQRKS